MKRVMVLSVAAMAILLSAATIHAGDKDKAKGKERVRATAKQAKELTEQEKQWREKLKAMTPEQRRVAMAQKALETELAPWQAVRKIAAEEKAEKTLAAINKVIAGKQEQLEKKLKAMAKKKAAPADKTKKENRQDGERRRQKKSETEG